jgi:hypothetical protein
MVRRLGRTVSGPGQPGGGPHAPAGPERVPAAAWATGVTE